jgi:predicted NAD/FAD-dependent oxidoreductase
VFTNSAEQNTVNQNLFEDKQVELERTIEALSKMLDDWVVQDDNGSESLSAQTRQETLGLMDVSPPTPPHVLII